MGSGQVNQTRDFGHGFRQPLNNMRLSVANMRMRLEGSFSEDDRTYLLGKLDRIEEQLERATRTVEEYEALRSGDPDGPPGSV